MEQVFIEDYVVSYLKQKKAEAANTPVRLALFGYAEKVGDIRQMTVYGAAREEENQTTEEIGREFFDGYHFLGYVNVYNNGKEAMSGYHIFYDENEAMQDYLLFCHAKNRTGRIKEIIKKARGKHKFSGLWTKLKMVLLGGICFLLAIIISTIDDYGKMNDFTRMAEQAIVFMEQRTKDVENG